MATLGTGQQSRRGGVAAVRASRPAVHTRRCGLPVKGDGFLESLRMGSCTSGAATIAALRRLCGGKGNGGVRDLG